MFHVDYREQTLVALGNLHTERQRLQLLHQCHIVTSDCPTVVSDCGFRCQIQLKEIFETDTDIALVLELVTGGELFDRYSNSPA